jgi:flagellar biosynthesis/type III secretory pathway M-ring protein FliF/YscJ
MNDTKTLLKMLIAAAVSCLLVLFVFFKLISRPIEDTSPDEQVKSQITKILTPLINKENFRVEVSQARKDFNIERQSVAILIDEAKALPHETLQQVDSLLRAAIGHDVARGDILRITNVAFTTPSASFSLTNEQKLYALEAVILLALLILAALYMRQKNAPLAYQEPSELPTRKVSSLSEQVISEPAKAAAILRVWLNEKGEAHG